MRGLVEAIARERDLNFRKAEHVRVALVLLVAGLGAVVLEALILGVRVISVEESDAESRSQRAGT